MWCCVPRQGIFFRVGLVDTRRLIRGGCRRQCMGELSLVCHFSQNLEQAEVITIYENQVRQIKLLVCVRLPEP